LKKKLKNKKSKLRNMNKAKGYARDAEEVLVEG
jgi:hypothetical protein